MGRITLCGPETKPRQYTNARIRESIMHLQAVAVPKHFSVIQWEAGAFVIAFPSRSLGTSENRYS